MTTEDYLTVQEAAALSGLTEMTVRAALSRGAVPFVLRYGRKLVRRKDWQKYRDTVRLGRPRKVRGAK